jgi:hypothetical protein
MLPVSRCRPVAFLAAAALVAGLGGCGGDDDNGSSSDIVSHDAPAASDFPSPQGKTLEQFSREVTPSQDVVVAPAGQVFTPGQNRVGFGVFDIGGEQITDAEVALYAASGNGPVQGPFPASVESLETDPAFEARTTADDPDAAKVVYVTDIDFDRKGEWRWIALIREDGEIRATIPQGPGPVVADYSGIPDASEQAPAVHTPTTADVGDVGQIDTRDPHDTMHDVDLADALGEKPVVLLFATPALCQSRVCGPVVDVAEQLKAETGNDVAFVHMEIFEDNTPPKLRSQVKAYGLPTEPWLFVIDENGKVSTRIEGAFSAAELQAALQKIT